MRLQQDSCRCGKVVKHVLLLVNKAWIMISRQFWKDIQMQAVSMMFSMKTMYFSLEKKHILKIQYNNNNLSIQILVLDSTFINTMKRLYSSCFIIITQVKIAKWHNYILPNNVFSCSLYSRPLALWTLLCHAWSWLACTWV